MAGKEAYCFRFREGWYLMLSLLFQNAAGHPLTLTLVLLVIAAALQFSFTVRKYKMPFFDRCGH